MMWSCLRRSLLSGKTISGGSSAVASGSLSASESSSSPASSSSSSSSSTMSNLIVRVRSGGGGPLTSAPSASGFLSPSRDVERRNALGEVVAILIDHLGDVLHEVEKVFLERVADSLDGGIERDGFAAGFLGELLHDSCGFFLGPVRAGG